MTYTVDDYGNRYRLVQARKPHRCTIPGYADAAECQGTIQPGDFYLRHVLFPGDTVSYLWTGVECLPCAQGRERPGIPPVGQRPAPKAVVARWCDSSGVQENALVVLGTAQIQEARAAAGLDTSTHCWGSSFAYASGWVLHRDGTASQRYPLSTGRGRAGVLFTAIREREGAAS